MFPEKRIAASGCALLAMTRLGLSTHCGSGGLPTAGAFCTKQSPKCSRPQARTVFQSVFPEDTLQRGFSCCFAAIHLLCLGKNTSHPASVRASPASECAQQGAIPLFPQALQGSWENKKTPPVARGSPPRVPCRLSCNLHIRAGGSPKFCFTASNVRPKPGGLQSADSNRHPL